MHSKVVHKHVHKIVNCIEQLTVNKQNTSFWKFSKRSNSGISLNWSIIDDVTTRNTTAYFFWPTL